MTPLVKFSAGSIWGAPLVKFTLHYDGPLPSSGNKPKNDAKWAIRRHLHPQLVDLWASHPALRAIHDNGYFPITGAVVMQRHHAHPGPVESPFVQRVTGNPVQILDLNAEIEKHGQKFHPLVRENYALHCGLKIVFQRKEPPGSVYQGGDLDGRIKTLLDALTMPQHLEQVIIDADAPPVIHCLMEDDSMVSELSVVSERLLTDADHPKDYVRLNIEVDVRVRLSTVYNQSFLG